MVKSDCRYHYLEENFVRLVEELKKNNCLRQNFEFLTQAEREARLNGFVERFIQSP